MGGGRVGDTFSPSGSLSKVTYTHLTWLYCTRIMAPALSSPPHPHPPLPPPLLSFFNLYCSLVGHKGGFFYFYFWSYCCWSGKKKKKNDYLAGLEKLIWRAPPLRRRCPPLRRGASPANCQSPSAHAGLMCFYSTEAFGTCALSRRGFAPFFRVQGWIWRVAKVTLRVTLAVRFTSACWVHVGAAGRFTREK